MDWINQNRFKNILIVILLFVNIAAVSVLWMQTAAKTDAQPKAQENRQGESVRLLEKALDLTKEQAEQFKSMQAKYQEQTKEYNNRLSALKRKIAEELFADSYDSVLMNANVKEIGELQSKVEMMRFMHFNELLSQCTPAQKEKFKPILFELFGRRPPKYEPVEIRNPGDTEKKKNPDVRKMKEPENNKYQEPEKENNGPPTREEKLTKYSDRLSLSDDQKKRIRKVMQDAMNKGEELRKRKNPDRDEIESEKARIRREEEKSIKQHLTDEQKAEYEKMLMNRKR